MLRYTVKILYELCLKNFLNLTKPSLLALHGSIAPCPGVHAGTFLIFIWHNSTVSRQLRYSLSRHLPCATTRNANSPQRKERKPRVPRGAHVLPPERIAKWLRYCRNYAHKTQKRPCMDAGARRTAPRTARFDGFVKHRNPSSIISYSILATQRSDSGSTWRQRYPGLTFRTIILNKVLYSLC